MTTKTLLGEILIDKNLVPKETIDQALRLQVGGNRRLGHILVRMKAINDDQLAEILEEQLGTTILDINDCSVVQAKKELPKYICRKYGVLPLKNKANNVLELAMANPSDFEAINDVEHYTGKVVEPILARHSDIDKAISRCIPIGIKDLFSPQINTMMSRTVAVFTLLCVIGLAGYTYDYIKRVKEGSVSITKDFVIYNNHDLTVAIDKKGKYSLQGHGAFADGLYKVEFPHLAALEDFIAKRDKDFSENQKSWLQWALQKASQQSLEQTIAKK